MDIKQTWDQKESTTRVLKHKQALRDSSGCLKERTEEPLGNLNKVYRAHFAWPTL